MRKLSALILALALCIGLTACEQDTQEVAPLDDISFDDMSYDSIRSNKTGETISLGMTQSEVEAILGAGKDLDLGYFGYGASETYLMIEYLEHRASTILIGAVNEDWCVKHGLMASSGYEEITGHYGDAELKEYDMGNEEKNFSSFSYSFDKSGNQTDEKSAAYTLSFFIRSKAILNSLSISNYK